MSNTSATGGYLSASPVLCQTALEDELHNLIVGVTGLPDELVRPRWQPDPPRVPGQNVNWCAFGITHYDPHNFPEARHNAIGEGCDELVAYEDMAVLTSFYGPGHVDLAKQLTAGLHIAQNRALLRKAGIAFVKAGVITPLPEAVALQWRARADLPLHFRLETRRVYAVCTLKGMEGKVATDMTATAADGTPAMSIPIGCRACARRCDLKQ